MSAGFLSLPGNIFFPPLGSTAGLGGVNRDLYPFPEPPEPFQEGVGKDVVLEASSPAAAPSTAIFFPEHEGDARYYRSPVLATRRSAPKVVISRPDREE